MTNFIDLGVITDSAALADAAVAVLTDAFPGYVPNDANLEVKLIEAVAPMAANVTDTAGQVDSAIFRKFGTDLVGVPYAGAAYARVPTIWTVTDSSGYTIPTGSTVLIGGAAFSTIADVTIPGGALDTTGVAPDGVLVYANVVGATGNGLSADGVGANPQCQPVDSLTWLQSRCHRTRLRLRRRQRRRSR